MAWRRVGMIVGGGVLVALALHGPQAFAGQEVGGNAAADQQRVHGRVSWTAAPPAGGERRPAAGVEVIATWVGPDGRTGTGDDVAYATVSGDGTTDVDLDGTPDPAGTWSSTYNAATPGAARDIPPGHYVVSLGDASLGQRGLRVADDLTLPLSVTLPVGRSQMVAELSLEGAGAATTTVRLDADGDGAPSAGDAPLAGVTVNALLDLGGLAGGTVAAAAVSDGSGVAAFPGLPAGALTTTLAPGDAALPADAELVTDGDPDPDGLHVASLAGGASADTTVLYRGTNQVTGTIRYTTESGPQLPLADVEVVLTWAGSDGQLSTPDDQTRTVRSATGEDAGSFSFGSVPGGSFRLAAGQLPGGLAAGPADLTIAGDVVQDLLAFGTGTVEGGLWWDVDGDGSSGAGEPDLPGTTVRLVSAGPDGLTGSADDLALETATGTSAPGGRFRFAGLPLGVPVDVEVDIADLPAASARTGPQPSTIERRTPTPEAPSVSGVDYGFVGPGSVEGVVFLDLSGDGSRSPDEIGLPAVPVTLSWAGPDGDTGTDDDITLTTTTSTQAADRGRYRFERLPLEDLDVAVDVAALGLGLEPIADPDGEDSEDEAEITLSADSPNRTDGNFAYRGEGTLGDTIFYDVNGSGDGNPPAPSQPLSPPPLPGVSAAPPSVLDTTDVPIIGAVLAVHFAGADGAFGTPDDIGFERASDQNGSYVTPGLPLGAYRVTPVPTSLPAGMRKPTYDRDGVVDGIVEATLTEDDPEDLDLDFAYTGEATLVDRAWFDLDGDGQEDRDEPGLAGLPVTVSSEGADGNAGTPDAFRVSVATASGNDDLDGDGRPEPAGTVWLGRLPTGLDLRLSIPDSSVPPGFDVGGEELTVEDLTTERVATTSLAVAGRNPSAGSFGYVGLGSVGGQVWLEGDLARGAFDPAAGDTGIEGLVVNVEWANPTGGPPLVRSVETGPDGRYVLGGLPHGSFAVDVDELPDGVLPGVDPQGDADLHSAAVLDIEVNADLGQNFSVLGTATAGGTIWDDGNGDGSQGEDEAGLAGTGVSLLFEDAGTGVRLQREAVTASSGSYRFDNMPPGEAELVVDMATVPTGLVQTYGPDGRLDAAASARLQPATADFDLDFGFQLQADLAVALRTPAEMAIDRHGVFSASVSNVGPGPANEPVVVAVDLPAGVVLRRVVGSEWTCEGAGRVRCSLGAASVEPGEEREIEMVVGANALAAPGVSAVATVSSETFDPNPVNDTSRSSVVVPLSVILFDNVLVDDLRTGRPATYELTVANDGPSTTRDRVIVVDELPRGLSYAGHAGTGWDCIVDGQLVECLHAAPLAPGESATVEVTARVEVVGRVVNVAHAVTGPNDVEQATARTVDLALVPRPGRPFPWRSLLLSIALVDALLVVMAVGIHRRRRRRIAAATEG